MAASLGLDHIYLRLRDLDALLRFFHETIGLPLNWPVRDEPFARYAWVNAGNVQLELWQARSNDDLPPEWDLPCIAGVAWWPQDVHQSREALTQAGVSCSEPKTWRTVGADGRLTPNFTNCLITDASDAGCQVFFCEWDSQAPITPWPKGESGAARRERFAADLAHAGGGAIGITGPRELHIESPDPSTNARVWSSLTGEPDVAAPGIALHHSQAAKMRIKALVFGVDQLQRAESGLRSRGVNTTREGDVLWMDRAALAGLCIGLIGETPAAS